MFPEIPVDALLAIWEEPSVEDPAPTEINDPEPSGEDPAPTCKHNSPKGRNANTQCKTKIKGGGEYCSKHF